MVCSDSDPYFRITEKQKQSVLGYAVLGTDEELPELLRTYPNVLITLGQIKTPERRISLFKNILEMGARFPVVRSPLAYVSPHAEIREGTIIMHHALVNAGARIGRNCIINTKALIEHDAVIEDHCHIATSAIINGGVRVGRGTFIGSNVVTREYISICDTTVIGCGAKITKSNQND